MYLLAGLLLGAKPDELYTGLWGYNAALTATAIGGVFYTPNRLSISIGLILRFLGIDRQHSLAPRLPLLKLPLLSVPFSIVTIGCCLILQHLAVSSTRGAAYSGESRGTSTAVPLERRETIASFRQQLRAALQGQQRIFCLSTYSRLKAICATSSMQSIAICSGFSQPRSLQLTCIRQEKSSRRVNLPICSTAWIEMAVVRSTLRNLAN